MPLYLGECRVTEWRCDNGQCISVGDRCDGRRDCSDNSDELGCKSNTVLTSTRIKT